jgi:hypothetical protein
MSPAGDISLHSPTTTGIVNVKPAPSIAETRSLELEREWVTQVPHMEVPNHITESSEDTTWKPNPLPLMTKHPPRITSSNTKKKLEDGILTKPCRKGENDLGWIQLEQKSLLWREKIEGSSVVTHEGLTTIAHSSRTEWTIMSGTWNHLRKVWGPTPDTLAKIQVSCKSQESLEEVNTFTPTRHLLVAIKQKVTAR